MLKWADALLRVSFHLNIWLLFFAARVLFLDGVVVLHSCQIVPGVPFPLRYIISTPWVLSAKNYLSWRFKLLSRWGKQVAHVGDRRVLAAGVVVGSYDWALCVVQVESLRLQLPTTAQVFKCIFRLNVVSNVVRILVHSPMAKVRSSILFSVTSSSLMLKRINDVL